jgi:hypothetical protein
LLPSSRQVAGLRAAFHIQPAEQAPQVNLDGVLADLEFFCNIAVAQAFVEHDEKLFLALGEFFGRCAWFGVGVVQQENLQGVGDFSCACRLGHVGVCTGFNRKVFKITGR